MRNVFSFEYYKHANPVLRILAYVKDFPKMVKLAYQRATKGYCINDTYDVSVWFEEMLPAMLKELKQNHYGGAPTWIEAEYLEKHPEYGFDYDYTYSHYDEKVDMMHDEALKYYFNIIDEIIHLLEEAKLTTYSIDPRSEEYIHKMKCRNRAIDLFKQYYNGLWW